MNVLWIMVVVHIFALTHQPPITVSVEMVIGFWIIIPVMILTNVTILELVHNHVSMKKEHSNVNVRKVI
uniref:Secreted protein n=1 Tax=Panstrongylus lignarius TaxID=156445 RepID=A0A224XUQ7_9HEMI